MMAKSGKAWTKQNDVTLTSVCDNLRKGVPFARCCKVSGISESTGHAWRTDGWSQIQENEDLDSDEELSFPARFALEVEIAARDFMAPMIQKIRDGADGKSKGDWRAAQSILNSLYPHEFSEKVATAKSARVEISGSVTLEMQRVYADHMQIMSMTKEELAFHAADVQSRLDHRSIEGEELDAEIAVAELEAGRDDKGSRPWLWLCPVQLECCATRDESHRAQGYRLRSFNRSGRRCTS